MSNKVTEPETMKNTQDQSSLREAIGYVVSGQHAFVASDEPAELDLFVSDLRKALVDEPIQIVNALETSSNEQFANRVVSACLVLLASINSGLSSAPITLYSYLEQTMLRFGEKNKQGYLVVNHIDTVINRQSTFEVEGAFRSAMQLYDDVAVVWLASRETVLAISRSDRPFYLSFRKFGL